MAESRIAEHVQGQEDEGQAPNGWPVRASFREEGTGISSTPTVTPGKRLRVDAAVTSAPPVTGEIAVSDIRDGAGDSIMHAASNSAQVRPLPPVTVATAQASFGTSRWPSDTIDRLTQQVQNYLNAAITAGAVTSFSQEGHRAIQLLASAARTTAQTTAIQQVVETIGCRVFLNVTAVPAVPGAGGLTVIIEARDPVSLAARPILTAAIAVQAVGMFTYTVYPAAIAGDTQNVQNHLGTNYRVRVAVGDAQSYTYSLGMDRIK